MGKFGVRSSKKKIKTTSSIANGPTTRSDIQDGREILEGTSIASRKSYLGMGLQLPSLPEAIHDPMLTDTSTVNQPLEGSASLNSKFKSLRET